MSTLFLLINIFFKPVRLERNQHMNYELLGQNVQTIRKMKGWTQQELSDKIGINLQSLSKIERGVNYPTLDTLEKLTQALEVTPNELLSGKLKTSSHMITKISEFLAREEAFNVELAYGQYDSPLDEEEWIAYELEKLRAYILEYVNADKRVASDLYPVKDFIQNLKFKKLLSRYDDYLCHDLFGETLSGHKVPNPYVKEVVENMIMDETGKVHRSLEYPDDFD